MVPLARCVNVQKKKIAKYVVSYSIPRSFSRHWPRPVVNKDPTRESSISTFTPGSPLTTAGMTDEEGEVFGI
jgi:hypothetical protein